MRINLRRHKPFCVLRGRRRGSDPSRVWPLIELEPRGKIHHVGRHETKLTVLGFKVIGQRVTSEVSSITQKSGKSGSDRMT